MKSFPNVSLFVCLMAVFALNVTAQRSRYNSGNQNSNSRNSNSQGSSGTEENPTRESKIAVLEYINMYLVVATNICFYISSIRGITKNYVFEIFLFKFSDDGLNILCPQITGQVLSCFWKHTLLTTVSTNLLLVIFVI